MTTSQSDAPWLTQEAYDRLSKELEYISGPGRQEIIERIEAARDEGDLKENGGYHAAREEQSKNEGRIAELKHLLETARVGEAAENDGAVHPGTVVTAVVAGDEMTFLFGNREIAACVRLLFDGQGRPSENLSLKEIVRFRQKIETDIQWLEAVLTELRSDLAVVRELEDAALDVADIQRTEENC